MTEVFTEGADLANPAKRHIGVHGDLGGDHVERAFTDDNLLAANDVLTVVEESPRAREPGREEVLPGRLGADVPTLECDHIPVEVVDRNDDALVVALPQALTFLVDVDVGAFAAVAQVEVGGHGAVHAAVGKVLEVTALMRDLDALRQIEIGDFVDFDGDDLFGHPALIPGVALELANGLLGILAPQISGEREDVEAWFAGAGAVEAIAEACFGIQIDLPVGAAAARARFDVELLAGRAEGALVFNPFILKEQLWIDVFGV